MESVGAVAAARAAFRHDVDAVRAIPTESVEVVERRRGCVAEERVATCVKHAGASRPQPAFGRSGERERAGEECDEPPLHYRTTPGRIVQPEFGQLPTTDGAVLCLGDNFDIRPDFAHLALRARDVT